MKNITIQKEAIKRPKNDTIKIKGKNLLLSLTVINGKQGDFFISYCPSINISGYGKTEAEAEEFIKVEMRTFCEDLNSMSSEERDHYLLSMGFKREPFHRKNFSKAYVDENGVLKNFDKGSIERKILEVA